MTPIQDSVERPPVIDRCAPQRVTVRAADADREETAAVLRRHYELGRLDTPEFELRIDRCYGAATVEELRGLVADLPRNSADSPTREPARLPLRPWSPVALVLPSLGVLALASVTGGQALWLAWPFVLLIVIVLRRRLAHQRPALQPAQAGSRVGRRRRRLRAAPDAQGDQG
jgi:hypothetical protein